MPNNSKAKNNSGGNMRNRESNLLRSEETEYKRRWAKWESVVATLFVSFKKKADLWKMNKQINMLTAHI